MRKTLKEKMLFTPLPVVIIGTYDKEGCANAMNAAWSGIYDYNKIYVSLSKHKTTDNLELKKEFSISFGTKDTIDICDYFGIRSGSKENKIKKAKVTVEKCDMVDAPRFKELPLCLECKMESFNDGILVGEIVCATVEDEYLREDGKVDLDKMQIICFDMVDNKYRVLGDVVGAAFKDGLKIANLK